MYMRDYINQGWSVHYAYQHGAEDMPANYPVPTTMFNAAIANFHNQAWSWKWAVEWSKVKLHEGLAHAPR